MFDLNIAVGRYVNCSFSKRNDGANTQYMIVNQDGPVCIINVINHRVPDGCIVVKDSSENAGVESELKRLGVIPKDPISSFQTGFVSCNIYKFDEDKALSL